MILSKAVVFHSFAAILAVGLLSASADAHTLDGYVTNALGADVIGALVQINGTSNITDLGGYYSVSIQNGTYSILTQGIGYKNYTGTVIIAGNTTFNHTLIEKDAVSTDDAISYGFMGAIISGMLFFAVIKRRRGQRNEI